MAVDDNQSENLVSATSFTPLTSPQHEHWRPRSSHVVIVVALLLLVPALWFLLTAKAVLFATDPADTKVEIDSALVVKLSDSHLMRSGHYDIVATADGYLPLHSSIEVDDAGSQTFTLVLQKKPGHLDVTSNPNGVTLSLDEQASSVTPTTLANLAAGEHQLSVTAPRYFPRTLTVDIEGLDKTQPLHIDLDPAWGTLAIQSHPQGAEVFVAGQLRGTTPLNTELLQSGEEISLQLAGYKPWQRILRVKAGAQLSVGKIQLDKVDGLLQLSSTPNGAGVTVDGQFMGRTPLQLALTPNLPHHLSLFLDGYHTRKQEITIPSFEERTVKVKLRAETGKIRINTKPATAEVVIDGVVRGKGGQTFQLSAKAHQITVRASGYASTTKWVTPRPSVEQLLAVTLLTESEARWASTPKLLNTGVDQRMKLFRPEATFKVGASRREAGRRANEIQRQVSLKRPFYLAEREVTNAEFSRFNAKHYSRQTDGITLSNPSQPVVNIGWQQAALFCNWLSKKDGLPPSYQLKDGRVVGFNTAATGYRLPTEAEWAWASRYVRGNMLKFPWGDSFPPRGKAGNYADLSATKVVGHIIKGYNDGYAVTAPVAKFSVNDKGLYDLGGNVAEWVNDYYGIEINLSNTPMLDPTGPEQGEFHVIRGSSWRRGSISELRLSFRDYGKEPRDDVGFRIARYAE